MQDVDHDPDHDHGPGLVPWQPLRPAPAPLPPVHVIPYQPPARPTPVFPALPSLGAGPGEHKISEHTSALRRTMATALWALMILSSYWRSWDAGSERRQNRHLHDSSLA